MCISRYCVLHVNMVRVCTYVFLKFFVCWIMLFLFVSSADDFVFKIKLFKTYCQNAILLEITCRGSYILMRQHIRLWYSSLMPRKNAHADIFINASSLNFGLSFHLYLYFVYMYVSSGGSGESVHMRRLARSSADH